MPELSASIDLPLVAKYLLAARGSGPLAHTLAANARAPARVLSILSKAAVGGAVTSDGTFGEVLTDIRIAESAFFTSLRSESVFFRLWDSGLRRVPLRTHLGILSLGATAYIVGEGQPKPLSRLTLSNPALPVRKAAAIIVVGDQVADDMGPAAQSLITLELRAAVADVVDQEFFDIIMPGAPSTPASGTGSDAMAADLRLLLGQISTTGAGALVWAAAPDVANRLSLINTGEGSMSPLGGEFIGLPALVSGVIPAGSLRLINAAGIAGNTDKISLDVSNQVDLQMSDAPEGAAAAMVSTWQNNATALKVEVSFGAERFRDDAAAEITGIEW
ncbi:phage major capsid protein [Rhizobium leguminosarum]|uniref:phage major capsid family protein n=1 Tax=Rhizobium leguminosarum TaxID=384 RepID=UPI00293DAC1B|nr:phage major capsid protein [Rhizobium leguminosarum]MDV4163099.1 phage major capsid protein [Rhizobium leguminosarum]MDV4172616.1 phage major capsid protein [Rhizobium leguminosarum]